MRPPNCAAHDSGTLRSPIHRPLSTSVTSREPSSQCTAFASAAPRSASDVSFASSGMHSTATLPQNARSFSAGSFAVRNGASSDVCGLRLAASACSCASGQKSNSQSTSLIT